MKERPILFSAPMVRAILEGHKTQTRRVIKEQPLMSDMRIARVTEGKNAEKLFWVNARLDVSKYFSCPYGQPGDRLWVREKWVAACGHFDHCVAYAAEFEGGADYPMFSNGHTESEQVAIERIDDKHGGWSGFSHSAKWRPSIFMPRWASRITLEITGIRVERLQDISEDDARAEGITDGGCLNCGEHEPCGCSDPTPDARDAYCYLWEQINGTGSWAANPWVWVVEFKRVDK